MKFQHLATLSAEKRWEGSKPEKISSKAIKNIILYFVIHVRGDVIEEVETKFNGMLNEREINQTWKNPDKSYKTN